MNDPNNSRQFQDGDYVMHQHGFGDLGVLAVVQGYEERELIGGWKLKFYHLQIVDGGKVKAFKQEVVSVDEYIRSHQQWLDTLKAKVAERGCQ
ncbi:MAG: hypothetical protein AMXMBFR84_37660 [Candidatus Hydrogenedentota bacterium]